MPTPTAAPTPIATSTIDLSKVHSVLHIGDSEVGYASGLCKDLGARFKAVTLPGDRITVGGEVTARDESARTVELKLFARKADGAITLEGSATVRFD